eukprot:1907940-Prymnesium_polylepis.1
MGIMIPQTNDGTPLAGIHWKQVTCGALVAARHIRAHDESVVPNLALLTANLTSLRSSVYDTGMNAFRGIVSYRSLVADGRQVIVGASRSDVSMLLAQLAAVDRIPQ